MDTFIVFSFFCVGTIFGSFSSVLVDRWKKGKSGIWTGRSECPSCHHILHWYNLIPIVSYLIQKRRCHFCGTLIPWRYLIMEITMGMIFAIMAWIGMRWQLDLYNMSFWILVFWGFVTGVYIFYDTLYMEVPEKILIPGIVLSIVLMIIGYTNRDYSYFPDSRFFHTYHTYVFDHIFAALIFYTFVFIQILIPGGYFLIKNHRWKDLGELFILYFIFPFVLIWDWIRPIFGGNIKNSHEEHEETDGDDIPTWIGAGDLIIALFIGITLGLTHGIVSFFIAYIIGSIIGIIIILWDRSVEKRKEVPLGLFLGIGWIITLLFYEPIQIYVNQYFFL